MFNLRRFFIGRPLRCSELIHSTVNNLLALAIFSSDSLSSVAYGTEEIVTSLKNSFRYFRAVKLPLDTQIIQKSIIDPWILPSFIAIAIVFLLVILSLSYRQTIMEYPNGGGAYTVAQNNLGQVHAQIAGVALMIGYILTVAVSVSSCAGTILSIAPGLPDSLGCSREVTRVLLALSGILFVTLINLRGVRESGVIFAIPTYGFIFCIFLLMIIGFQNAYCETIVNSRDFFKLVLNGDLTKPIICAFASGCTALTGVEAISNGVPAFRHPAARNAAKTMTYMAILLAVMFLGVTLLTRMYHVEYNYDHDSGITLLYVLTKAVYGYDTKALNFLLKGCYWATQGFTIFILVVAANTAYAGFPRLAAMHASDGFLPKQFATIGDRLVLSNGIFILSLLSGLLVFRYNAIADNLLPFYAFGVFLGFAISQAGMVAHWYTVRGHHWKFKLIINGVGSFASVLVMMIVAYTKWYYGARYVVMAVPVVVIMLFGISYHYKRLGIGFGMIKTNINSCNKYCAVVLVSVFHDGVMQAINYAKLIAGDKAEAITFDIESDDINAGKQVLILQDSWERYDVKIPLRRIISPYRKVFGPILREIDRLIASNPDAFVTVIIPEFSTNRWWEYILHHRRAFWLKVMLAKKPRVVVVSTRTDIKI